MAQTGNTTRAVFSVDTVIEAQFWCLFGAQASVNRLRWAITSAVGTGVTYSDVLTEWASAFPLLFRALMSVQATYRGVGLWEVNNPLKPAPAYDDADHGVGSVAGDVLPSQVCGLLSFEALFVGPSQRGRMFLPFPSEGSNGSGGSPSAGYVADMDALGVICTTPVVVTNGGSSINLDPVIYHKSSNTSTRITGHIARGAWATQRRRAERSKGNTSPV